MHFSEFPILSKSLQLFYFSGITSRENLHQYSMYFYFELWFSQAVFWYALDSFQRSKESVKYKHLFLIQKSVWCIQGSQIPTKNV